VPGLAIVYFHNRWTGGWPVVVTVTGWLSLAIGRIRKGDGRVGRPTA